MSGKNFITKQIPNFRGMGVVATIFASIYVIMLFVGWFVLFLSPAILMFIMVNNNAVPEIVGVFLFLSALVAYSAMFRE